MQDIIMEAGKQKSKSAREQISKKSNRQENKAAREAAAVERKGGTNGRKRTKLRGMAENYSGDYPV
jgi:hypothetical protein